MAVTAVDTGHRKVSRAAEVHAPASELFDIVADPHSHGELDGSGTVTETFDYSQVGPLHARALELLGYPQRNAAGIEATLRKLQARYPGS
jgi:hypothetical protein